ncbi:type VII secretion system-associated protein [Catenuloplanes japonicus]|uniref:type VII secretion system-associated protein n=1 Tax=Catenuloplanes japonicus TaxID=33876 RepID=UPI0005272DC4|nr:type VII secretion system-associated protein [Catenuloplanes japonicus]
MAEERWDTYFLFMDPDWVPAEEDEEPPIEAVIGFWPLREDGEIAPFVSNSRYRPRDENAVTDPLDAVLRLAGRGDATAAQIQLLLRDSLMDLGLNGDGRPLITRAPDGVPCVVLATSATQRRLAFAPQWRRADLAAVVAALPPDTDALVNPGGPVPFRLTGGFLRDTAAMTGEEQAAAYERMRAEQPDRELAVIPWVVGDRDATVTFTPR